MIVLAIRTINSIVFKDVELVGTITYVGDMAKYPLEYENIAISEIKEGFLNGFHFIPNEKSSKGSIVVFGGSDGGCDYDRAIELANDGYEVIALFYFGQDNQPKTYNNVPLEFFEEFLNYADNHDIDTTELTLIGTSKGAELTLLLSNLYSEIDNIVLFSPSSYVF